MGCGLRDDSEVAEALVVLFAITPDEGSGVGAALHACMCLLCASAALNC